MKNVKKYRDFCNEEINLKNALIGGAIAASTIGCDSTELNKRQGSEWITTPTPIESATEIKDPIFPIRVEHYPSLRDDVASFKELTIYLTK